MTESDITVVSVAITVAAGFLVALAGWSLRRLGQARDRELRMAAQLESISSSLAHVRNDMQRIESCLGKHGQSLDDLRQLWQVESRQTAVEISELRATLTAHIATAHGAGGTANGRTT